MAAVTVTNIELVGENPTVLVAPLQIRITFECIQPLEDDLQWKLVYVGSAESQQYDQELDSIWLGPVQVGVSQFILETEGPDVTKIPPQEAIGPTCILLSGLYLGHEFIRVGYFVNKDYSKEFLSTLPNPEELPAVPQWQHIQREILVTKPRVTRYFIEWTAEAARMQEPMPSNSGQSEMMIMKELMAREHDRTEPKDANPFKVEIRQDFVERLGSELSKKIFQYLDADFLPRCLRVSKRWKNLIEQGVELTHVDISDQDWEYQIEDADGSKLVSFIINQCSPTHFKTLKMPTCPGFTDELLDQWLTKCGKTVSFIDVSWCSSLTPKAIDIICERCTALEGLKVPSWNFFHSTDKSEEIQAQLRQQEQQYIPRLSKFATTLKTLCVSGMSTESLSFFSQFKQLEELGLPYGQFTESSMLNLVSQLPNLKNISLEFCLQVSSDTINYLRGRQLVVQASHSPRDFMIDISIGSKGETLIAARIKGWKSILTTEELQELGLMKMSPHERLSFPSSVDMMLFNGTPKEAEAAFLNAGFDDVELDLEEEAEVEGEDMMCEVCKLRKDEERLLVCDECERGFHAFCLQPPVTSISKNEEWLCDECTADLERSTKRQKTE